MNIKRERNEMKKYVNKKVEYNKIIKYIKIRIIIEINW